LHGRTFPSVVAGATNAHSSRREEVADYWLIDPASC
jgi:hypothetical protein